MQGHYAGIVVGYAIATALLWGLWLLARPLVAGREEVAFKRSWLELVLFGAAVMIVLAIGQAFVGGLLLPNTTIVFQSLNQIVIFSPILALVASHPQRFLSGGLPLGPAAAGLPIGVALASVSVVAYAWMRGADSGSLVAFIFQPTNIDIAVQVLLEDIAIAALLLRVRTIIGTAGTVAAVAILFAAAHIPAMLAQGGGILEGAPALAISAFIGVLVMGAVLCTRSIWWAWPVHTCMDIAQFYTPR